MDIVTEIAAWQREQFPDYTLGGAFAHLEKEYCELLSSRTFDVGGATIQADPLEAADVAFMAIAIIGRLGLDPARILRAKLLINQARRWPAKPNDQGFYRHAETQPPAAAESGEGESA